MMKRRLGLNLDNVDDVIGDMYNFSFCRLVVDALRCLLHDTFGTSLKRNEKKNTRLDGYIQTIDTASISSAGKIGTILLFGFPLKIDVSLAMTDWYLTLN